MARQPQTLENNVELADIPGTSLRVSRIAIGTWAIGGWMWGGTDEAESISTIRAALEHGINVVDTAPVYGFGRSEEIVGKAIAEGGQRSRVTIATKVGLEWRDGNVFRNASRDRIMREIEDSLRRLRTDHIDIYQVHWPDPLTPTEETAEAMHTLYKQGKIRAIGVSNFSIDQMEQFRRVAPIETGRGMPNPWSVPPSPFEPIALAAHVRIGTEAWRKNALRAGNDSWQGGPSEPMHGR
jgi:aryl-alcohol dehydrogenase-like predicted oxidoreductase